MTEIYRTEYFENENPCFTSNYKNGYKNGKWTIFYPNNIIHIQCEYDNDVMNGSYEEFDMNGKVINKGNFNKGVKHGFWIENKISCGNYNLGEREGIWINKRFNMTQLSYYANGKITKVERLILN